MGFAGALLGAGLGLYNTQRTARKQDEAAAESIRHQSRIQQRADARVHDEVTKLEGSTAAEERADRLGKFMDTLRTNRARIEGGLTSEVGGDDFQAAQAGARAGVAAGGAEDAGLLSRIDAPAVQRQGEAKGFGLLGSDLGLLQRESSGQSFLDELRMRAIRRNPWMDAAGALIQGLSQSVDEAGSMMTGGMGGFGGGKSFGGAPNLKGG